jgi:hypothetical protein
VSFRIFNDYAVLYCLVVDSGENDLLSKECNKTQVSLIPASSVDSTSNSFNMSLARFIYSIEPVDSVFIHNLVSILIRPKE